MMTLIFDYLDNHDIYILEYLDDDDFYCSCDEDYDSDEDDYGRHQFFVSYFIYDFYDISSYLML